MKNPSEITMTNKKTGSVTKYIALKAKDNARFYQFLCLLLLASMILFFIVFPHYPVSASDLLGSVTIEQEEIQGKLVTVEGVECPRCGNKSAPDGTFVAIELTAQPLAIIHVNEETVGAGCTRQIVAAVDKIKPTYVSGKLFYCEKCGHLKGTLNPIVINIFRKD